MFNDEYVYVSSMSKTMRAHFHAAASSFTRQFEPRTVLEIGSNDGVFIKHFDSKNTIAVEPCSNFAKITNDDGYYTYSKFWTTELSKEIVREHGKQDLIFSANCMCHIQDLDDAFNAVGEVLSERGVFVFEDPSLEKMISRNSYDQIYDEHAHIFSVLALSNVLEKHNMEIFKVENLTVHGGSNRIYVKKKSNKNINIHSSVDKNIILEKECGLENFERYLAFAKNVEESKTRLLAILQTYKNTGKKIVSYGATSKSTTIFNYCGISTDYIDYIVDTTPRKQGKLSPGMHIPVISPQEGFDETVDVAFLGAWNFSREICKKEKNFLDRGGKFITHVPKVSIVYNKKEYEENLNVLS